ncbi:putative Pentapeptide repeat protein [Hyella patelloides LEGE 07179]|uniref:Putative Pentapeptide repeat protein n=1 Tax=Hyella patelloides LEGE 07179 TaxID=945734 RepID=A0A563VTF3_9CYAN|nr:pentapeptide repeat-containing protein [Hyella patelloides]VEP14551.1 putative Pentapeptide repeat protein [Hyella patelloides LEGE 07179]
MADQEHLEKLNKGVKAWNQWRKDNPNIRPDLFAKLLNNTNLSGANLSGVELLGVNFTRSNLTSANLSCANLYIARLSGANLSDANLTSTNLIGANLIGANLSNVNLSGANLSDVKLSGANLSDVNLTGANLSNVKLSGANLSDIKLSGAILKRVQALDTNFAGATLTGACIEDWNINSKTNLENVKCDYIYLKEIYFEEKQKSFYSDRRPHDPYNIFAPGEFTKRYQKILETVDLYFGEGIDWQVFLESFQKLQEEEKLKIQDGDRQFPIVQGIKNTGDGSFVIEIGVSPDTDKGEVERSFKQIYQPMVKAKEEQIKFLHEELNIKREELFLNRQEKNELLEIIKLRANQQINVNNYLANQQRTNNMTNNKETKIDKYFKTEKAGIVNNEGDISGGIITGEYNEAAPQNLTQAAAEIQQLLEQLSKTYPTKTPSEKMVVGAKVIEEITNNPNRWQKPIKVIKAMGIEALAEAVDNPIFNIAKAGIEAALE